MSPMIFKLKYYLMLAIPITLLESLFSRAPVWFQFFFICIIKYKLFHNKNNNNLLPINFYF